MDGKTSEWRPGPTVCRCCLTEGCYKDISTEYFWMGKREVYAEMLSETLNVSIAYSQSGGPNSNSRLICEPCISRLRDAAEFKRQVQECEKTFMQHLDPGTAATSTITLEVEAVPEQKDKSVKLEQVKTEKQYSDDDFGGNDFAAADEDDDDDLDDQPLTKFASKVPKKESVDLLDLFDNSQITLKRKSKTKTPTTKKTKVAKKDPVKATAASSKAVAKPVAKKKKEQNPMYIAKQNAKKIVQYTTAYPFRLPEGTMVCVYCCENYPDPNEFRKHMENTHQVVKLTVAFAHLNESYIKVDCTDLRCRICNERFDKIKEVASHIKAVHGKNINLDYDIGMQPFKVKTDLLLCGICDYKASTMCTLSRHIHQHFLQCTCESCGKSYATTNSLSYHIKFGCSHANKERRCGKCKESFDTPQEMRCHLESSKMCGKYICSVCGERFGFWRWKQEHMEEAHGIPKKNYPCPECGMIFNKTDTLRSHFKIVHTTDHLICSSCGKKFARESTLNKHMIVHTGEKLFTCSVCSKSFSTKYSLSQHMWIHSEVKKHECKICDKKFNQRVSWKVHMKSRHPESCDF